jgi:multiple sugar transport system permease protein
MNIANRVTAAHKRAAPLVGFRARRELWCLAFIAPQLALFLLFTAYPIVMSYVYAFFDWDGYGPLKDYVGFNNFVETLTDSLFWNAFRNSLLFMTYVVAVQVPLALLLALLLNAEKLQGKVFYRTIYFLPVVTTTAVVGLIMRFIFGAYKGVVNELLIKLGLLTTPVDWLGSIDTAFLIVVLVGIWKTFGMKLVYWLAGIQSLPKELFESARIDGASAPQLLRYITIPLLLPVGSVILLMSAVNALHVFDLVKSMTDGGPAFKTDMVDVYIYRYAFSGNGGARVGFASAAGVVYGVAVMIISLVLGLLVRWSGGRRKAARF